MQPKSFRQLRNSLISGTCSGMGPTLALLLSLAPCWAERKDPARVEHVALIAEAVDSVTEDQRERAALVTIAKFESGLCWSVASGRVHGGDGEGPWQIEPGSRRQKPYSGTDLKSLSHAAGEALWLWRHSWQCGPALESRFRAYAGLPCSSTWSGAHARTGFLFFVSNRLQQLAQVAKD